MRKLAILLMILCFESTLLNQAEITIAQGMEKAKADFPEFQAHLVDIFPGGYKVAVADLNNDSRLDIIGLSTTPAHLVWYENPSWENPDPRPVTMLETMFIHQPKYILGDLLLFSVKII